MGAINEVFHLSIDGFSNCGAYLTSRIAKTFEKKAAVEEGIIAGGGTTLLHLAPQLNDWATENLIGDEFLGATIVAPKECNIMFELQMQSSSEPGWQRHLISSDKTHVDDFCVLK